MGTQGERNGEILCRDLWRQAEVCGHLGKGGELHSSGGSTEAR